MRSYEEIKNYLEKNYKRYFEILNINIQTRAFMFIYDFENKKEIKNVLNKCLDNYIECLRISSTIPSRFGNKDDYIYKHYLELANEIKDYYKGGE